LKDIDALGAIAKVDCGFRVEGRALGMVDGVMSFKFREQHFRSSCERNRGNGGRSTL
jgi:hypothetical protein